MSQSALPLTRRSALRLAVAGGATGLLGWARHDAPPPARNPPGGPGPAADLVTPDAQAAIDRGLAFLARAQLDDGAFTSDRPGGGAAAGIAAQAGLALLAGGHHPGRGRYARTVSRVVDYLLACAAGPAPGFLASADAQRAGPGEVRKQAMYSHGFGCVFLSEVSGTLPDPARQRRVHAAVEQAVAYTVRTQGADGGWKYTPRPPYSDVSVTAAQLMALRAARNAGAYVRREVVDAGVGFLRSCQQPDGGFGYARGSGASSAFARTAACLVGLFSGGVYAGTEIDSGLQYLMQFLPVRPLSPRELPPAYYYYAQYYAALAMWTAGGDRWEAWFPAVRAELLARCGGGGWPDPTFGPAYATAMSLIVLQLSDNYLPTLQA